MFKKNFYMFYTSACLTLDIKRDSIAINKGNKVKILNWPAAVKSENLLTLKSACTALR